MAESWIEFTDRCTIRRPIDVVRAHFVDIQHHIDHDVHKAVRYEITGRKGDRICSRTTLSVLGQQLVDEVEYYIDARGDVVQEFVGGKNKGGTLIVSFQEESPGVTRALARVRVPVRGLDRLLKPLIAWAFRRVLAQAISEDVADIEGGYAPALQAAAV